MKILIAPAKNMNLTVMDNSTIPFYIKHGKEIFEKISNLSTSELETIYKISEKKANELYELIRNEQHGTAFFSYDGLVFKNARKNVTSEDYKYIKEHVHILDSLYGILNSFDLVRHYRLDFKTKINHDNQTLLKFWDVKVNEFLKDEVIVNLASEEFSKLIKVPNIKINFLFNKNGQLKSIPTYAKQARGLYLNWMIKNKVTLLDLTNFNEDGFTFDKTSSNQAILTFIKDVN